MLVPLPQAVCRASVPPTSLSYPPRPKATLHGPPPTTSTPMLLPLSSLFVSKAKACAFCLLCSLLFPFKSSSYCATYSPQLLLLLLLPSTCCSLPLLMKTPRPPSPFRLNSNAGTGCVSAFVRRLLCASLGGNAAGDSGAAQKKTQPVSPSVVARMMGLDSMPVFPCASPESGRSLCEAPVFLRQENENFLVLSFVPEEKVERIGRKCKLKKRKEEFSSGVETRNNRKNSVLGKENSPEKEHRSSKPCGIDDCNSTKSMPCCCHQDLSPVSVLDYPFLIRYSNSLDSEEEISEFQNPRRLSSKFENLNCTASDFLLHSSSREPPATPETTSNFKPVGQDHSQNWLRIIELTEEEVKNKVWWSEENREIAAEVAKKVLDLLLEETVSEISNSIIRSCS
ncbi:uncharacterized protein LOC122012877 isoform X2 [Zingiber officinale]|uniref:uncharacterized protein LOC122012877 isoform X2 n=1 Tax=Zingiber officinale TaxID=94328 RepID=UPI001C4A83EE|nr:uncharacterized protein LOC122012877 isoform X2 [Zingiber officinale]